MPTQWAHSVFFGDKGESPIVERDMALMGVGRGIVLSIALFGLWADPWLPLLLVVSALAAPKILSGARGIIFKMLGGKEYGAFLEFLSSESSNAARKAVFAIPGPDGELRPETTRNFHDMAYQVAGQRGCSESGWKRRLLIYFWFGRKMGKW